MYDNVAFSVVSNSSILLSQRRRISYAGRIGRTVLTYTKKAAPSHSAASTGSRAAARSGKQSDKVRQTGRS